MTLDDEGQEVWRLGVVRMVRMVMMLVVTSGGERVEELRGRKARRPL